MPCVLRAMSHNLRCRALRAATRCSPRCGTRWTTRRGGSTPASSTASTATRRRSPPRPLQAGSRGLHARRVYVQSSQSTLASPLVMGMCACHCDRCPEVCCVPGCCAALRCAVTGTAASAGTYLIVRDLAEAQYVVDYILRGGDREHFLAKFAKAMSAVRLPCVCVGSPLARAARVAPLPLKMVPVALSCWLQQHRNSISMSVQLSVWPLLLPYEASPL